MFVFCAWATVAELTRVNPQISDILLTDKIMDRLIGKLDKNISALAPVNYKD
jgi:hypothetical protein